MSSQEKRLVRAEGVYRYRTGAFYARGSIKGKPTLAKLEGRQLNNGESGGPHEKSRDSIWKCKKPTTPVRLVQLRSIVHTIREQEFADTRHETADFVEAESILGLGHS